MIFFLFVVIYRRHILLFIIVNDPLVNIDIDVNLFNNIYPDLNGNQSSEYYDYLKFNKLSINSDLLLLNFNKDKLALILIHLTVSSTY